MNAQPPPIIEFECRCPRCNALVWRPLPGRWVCACGTPLIAATHQSNRRGHEVWVAVVLSTVEPKPC